MGNLVVSIGRQYGSGGREVGKLLAAKLGISFYDKEIITSAAKASGLSEEFFKNADQKKTSSFLYSLTVGMNAGKGIGFNYGDLLTSDTVFKIQSNIIKELRDKEPCVIVGRCADYVLSGHDNLVRIFIHADEAARVKRIAERKSLSDKEALAQINKNDKKRSNYYEFYTGNEWGNVTNYDIALNTTKVGVEKAADIIADYIKITHKMV